MRSAVLLLLASLVGAGCLSHSPVGRRLDRYRPDERRRGAWFASLHRGASEGDEAQTAALPSTGPAAGGLANPPAMPPHASSELPPAPIRSLVTGDRLTISLLGIPDPQQIEDVIDDAGNISLPHIGDVQVAGITTSEAENLVRRAYIDGLYYRDINVIIVSKDDEFFVRGEVKREGRYPLTGAMTLVKAISVAGGYTEFADKNEAEIMRGEEILEFDMKRIHDGRDHDPPLQRGDVINVRRRWIW